MQSIDCDVKSGIDQCPCSLSHESNLVLKSRLGKKREKKKAATCFEQVQIVIWRQRMSPVEAEDRR